MLVYAALQRLSVLIWSNFGPLIVGSEPGRTPRALDLFIFGYEE